LQNRLFPAEVAGNDLFQPEATLSQLSGGFLESDFDGFDDGLTDLGATVTQSRRKPYSAVGLFVPE
jgi:hypothetical protein